MFDMEMLNDALNMPRGVLPLFSTGKEQEKSTPAAPSIVLPAKEACSPLPPRYCSSNVYLSKRKEPFYGLNPPSWTLLDRLPVWIDSRPMALREPTPWTTRRFLPMFLYRKF